MLRVRGEAIDGGHAFKSRVFISKVSYDAERLVVTVTSPSEGTTASAAFAEVIGFRVLDEGDLLEFWPTCAADHGWLFLVHESGWLDQEMQRPGFLHRKVSGLSEYFIAGQNHCISVLAGQAPRVEVGRALDTDLD